MQRFIRFTLFVVMIASMLPNGPASGEDIRWVSDGNGLAADPNNATTTTTTTREPGCIESCCPSIFGCECEGIGGCECDPPRGIVGLLGMDSFKGVSDLDERSNFGAVTGLNAAMPIPGLKPLGFGWQLGMTYGVYDWDGSANGSARSQQQVFVTTGFYRKAGDDQLLSFGVVYDWMVNDQWGTHGVAPTLSQWRGQIECALDESNAIGVYGCVADRRTGQWCIREHWVEDRAVQQINLFWHHKFLESGADSWLWFGLPENRRLRGDGSLGDWILGAAIQVPISDRLALYGNAQYMHPSVVGGELASVESDWNVGAGIAWYFGGHAVSRSLNGKCWLPYMPVANNSTFLVDEYSPNYY